MATTASPQNDQGTPEQQDQAGIVHDARGALAKNTRLLREIAALELALKRRPSRRLVSTDH